MWIWFFLIHCLFRNVIPLRLFFFSFEKVRHFTCFAFALVRWRSFHFFYCCQTRNKLCAFHSSDYWVSPAFLSPFDSSSLWQTQLARIIVCCFRSYAYCVCVRVCEHALPFPRAPNYESIFAFSIWFLLLRRSLTRSRSFQPLRSVVFLHLLRHFAIAPGLFASKRHEPPSPPPTPFGTATRAPLVCAKWAYVCVRGSNAESEAKGVCSNKRCAIPQWERKR